MIKLKEGIKKEELILNGFVQNGKILVYRIKQKSFELVIRVNDLTFREDKDMSIIVSPINMEDIDFKIVKSEYEKEINILIKKGLFYETIHDFKQSIINGGKGEKTIHQFLGPIVKQNNISYEDVSFDKAYQELDIDFVLRDGNEKIAVEVKTDSYVHTKNMFYEEMSAEQTRSIGCFHKTKANVMLYYFSAGNKDYENHVNNHDLYVIYNMNKFKDWFEKRKKDFKKHRVKNYRYTKGTYTATGRLIPRATLDAEMNDFAIKLNIRKDTPQMLLDCIKKTIPYFIDEDIKSSSKVRLKPMFNLKEEPTK